jgi:HAD superfamily hydrolase (TIGR01458 family)
MTSMATAAMRSGFAMQDIKGVLIDLDGVVHQRGAAIPGSIEAIALLRQLDLDFRFVTNTTRQPLRLIARELENAGVAAERSHVFTPALAARVYIQDHDLDPFFVIRSTLKEDFANLEPGKKRAVVIADAYDEFTYANLNEAFRLIEQGAEFLALATNRSFRDADGELSLDVGGFVACLEYASNRKAHVLGKPSPDFFRLAVSDMGLLPANTVMIGDDAEFDVSAAIKAGLHGILVRTGKYKPGAENAVDPKPDAVAQNLLEAAGLLATL